MSRKLPRPQHCGAPSIECPVRLGPRPRTAITAQVARVLWQRWDESDYSDPSGNSSLLSDGTWDYVYTGGATPTEQIATSGSSPTTDLLLSDESGNVRGLVQLSSGTHQDQLVNYTDYAAYGNPITQSGGAVEAGGLTTPQTALNSNYVGSTPMGFGEGYTDATGLIYLISRYYDPQTGQFLSVDPEVKSTGELYEFTDDNPVNESDSTGTISTSASSKSAAEVLFITVSIEGWYITYNCYPVPRNINEPLAATYGIYVYSSACEYRVWLHQKSGGGGWAYCISPETSSVVPPNYMYPKNIYFSDNALACDEETM